MTIRYIYVCDICNKDYIEQRQAEENQIFTKCECSGNFILNSQEEL